MAPVPLLGPKTPGKRPSGRSSAPPQRSSGGGLGGGLGNIPKPVLIGGVVLAVAIGLYLRYKGGSSTTAATTAAPALADTGTTGGASSGGAAGPDYTPFQSLADSINGLTGILGCGGTFQINSGGGGPVVQPFALSGSSTATPPAGTVIDPVTGTTTNRAGYPTNTSYADLGVTPPPTGPPASLPVQALTIPSGFSTQVIPPAPHSTATHVLPASSAPKVKPPISGYAQQSKSNLH
jgi:hypothetical protein